MLQAIADVEPTRVMPQVAGLDLGARHSLVGQLYRRGWVSHHVFQGDQVAGGGELSLTDAGWEALHDAWNAQDADANDPSTVGIDEKRRRRTQYMKTLYDMTDGNPAVAVLSSEVGRRLGWTDSTTKPVARYLRTQGRIVYRGMGPLVALTPGAVDEVEAMISEPDRPIGDLAGLTVSFGDVSGGTVQIAAGGSVAAAAHESPTAQSASRRLRITRWAGQNLWLFALGVLGSLVATFLYVAYFDDEPPDKAVLVIDNRVTNGPADMREDDEPVRLAREPTLACVNDPACRLDQPTYESGDQVTAICQLRSPSPITNGVSGDSSDDANPGLVSSNRWYGIRHEEAIRFINEVWVQSEDRGGEGLRPCTLP